MTGAGVVAFLIAPVTVFNAALIEKISLTATVFFVIVILWVLLLVGYRWRQVLPTAQAYFIMLPSIEQYIVPYMEGFFFAFFVFPLFPLLYLVERQEGKKRGKKKEGRKNSFFVFPVFPLLYII